MKTPYRLLLLAALAVITTGLGCRTSREAAQFKPVTLEYWGVFESPDDIAKLTQPYSQRHPKITINYRKFREEEYKQKLLEAWSQGQGPDLFMIPSTRMREFLNFMTPMPATMQAPVEYTKGTIKKEKIVDLVTYNGYTAKQIRDLFLDAVASDVVIDNAIYGLPYAVDTLSVFYNRQMLKENNIALPATTWQELVRQAGIISKADANDHIVQSAIALGTTNNISNVFDIVSTMMLQVGIEMGDANGTLFQRNQETINAIQFFTSFAKPGLQNYSWAATLPQALDAFTAGKLAYFIGYSFHAPVIRVANPRLDWDVIPIFAPEGAELTTTYANYWVTVVHKPPEGAGSDAKLMAELAWQYLLETTAAANVKPFLDNPENPRTTALKGLVTEQQQSQVLGPFAQNLLHATSWYKGYNYALAEQYFIEMIKNVDATIKTGGDPINIIRAAGDLISQTYRPPTP